MTNLPQANVLASIGSAVVVSVICTWTIATHFQEQTQRDFDRVHARLDSIVSTFEPKYASPRSVATEDVWEMPAAPEMPAEGE